MELNLIKRPVFIDMFAGCGGLSLGLINAGWTGFFAVEINTDAFNTYKNNLIKNNNFNWPLWLSQEPHDIRSLINNHREELQRLNGKIDLIAGGPPCQGFSFAGRRTHSDPRNSLVKEYLKVIEIIEPRFLLIENVIGFTQPFRKNGTTDIPYSEQIKNDLEAMGYIVFSKVIDFSKFGVPQYRNRFILIGIKDNDISLEKLNGETPFDLLDKNRIKFLKNRNLPIDYPVSVKEAIGDLEINNSDLIDCLDSNVRGYKQVSYDAEDKEFSPFIKMMRNSDPIIPNSLRLAKHSVSTIKQFNLIMKTCQLGKVISKSDRNRLGIKKHAITPLKDNFPSSTITTLPDDIIHYSEPRILTVRENARLQTFPDWFQFFGNYTTGGKNRKLECPRYTQVGNAVPPLFAEAIGEILINLKEMNIYE